MGGGGAEALVLLTHIQPPPDLGLTSMCDTWTF